MSPELRVLRDMDGVHLGKAAARLRGVTADGELTVKVQLAPGVSAEQFLKENPEIGSRTEVQVSLGNELQLKTHLTDLNWLSGHSAIHRIKRPQYARSKAYMSEGVAQLFSNGAWSDLGITGEGVRVAVIDVGFEGYKQLLGEELPLYTDGSGLVGPWEEDNHGTAVAEIIHDVAPGAEISLYSFETELEFRQLLQKFVEGAYQADVINASVGFDNVWHADGSSPYTQAVNAVVEAGMFYIAAAGNEAENYRWGTLSDIDGNGYLEIDGDEGTWVAAGRYGSEFWAEVSLRWSDGMESSANDLDLLITNESDTVECGRSENPQEGLDNPFEYVSCELDSSWGLAWIADYSEGGADGKTAWLYSYSGIDSSQMVQSGSLTLPADAEGALTVGAYVPEGDTIAWYSSQGPTEDGRVKPDLVAPSGVSTESFGTRAAHGTSFSAPHLAGLAALVLEQKPSYSVESLREYLLSQTRDLGVPGPDSVFGVGAVSVMEQPEGCGCTSGPRNASTGWVLLGLFGLVGRRRR